jgi:hypothetical protein
MTVGHSVKGLWAIEQVRLKFFAECRTGKLRDWSWVNFTGQRVQQYGQADIWVRS